MFYRVGVHVPDPFFLLEKDDKQYVFLDSREYGVFQEHNENPNIECVLLDPIIARANKLTEDVSWQYKLGFHLLKMYDVLGVEIFIPANFPVMMADYLRSKGAKLTPISPFYPERLKKSAKEVAALRESLVRTQKAFALIEQVLRDSTIEGDEIKYNGETLTSELLKARVEQVLLEQDMINIEGMIISCGSQAAIPHHPGSGVLRPNQTIICDIFPQHRATGYFADMTRTYVKGEPSEDVRNMYAAVLRAQETAMEKLRPGMKGKEVHQICVDIFAELGYESNVGERGFCHGTGHGLGLDIHEEPFMRMVSEPVLEVGQVITVEPGLYYSEKGGVRIEDVVVVTADGCENLTQYHKDYIIS